MEICYKLIEVHEGPLTIGILAFTQNCINGIRAVLAPQHTCTCLEVHFPINLLQIFRNLNLALKIN